MRRILVLLTLVTLAGGLASFGTLGLAACGGNDKPPLTPDQIEGEEAGAPAPPGSAMPGAK